jgi:hypothetical protein
MEKIIEGKRCIRHGIKVSEYVYTELWIPETMTPVDLKGLMDMSNKLIKINDGGEIVSVKKANKYDIEIDRLVKENNQLVNSDDEVKKQKILSMRNEGKSWQQIGDYFKVAKGAIYMWARNHKLNCTTYRERNSSFGEHKSIMWGKILTDYDNTNSPLERKQVAAKYGKTLDQLQKSVSKWRRKLGR